MNAGFFLGLAFFFNFYKENPQIQFPIFIVF